MELKNKLVYLRREKGLSQTDLAEEMLVSRQAISKWETGIAMPTAENLKVLSELFDVSVDSLLNDEMEPEPVKKEMVPVKEAVSAEIVVVPEEEGIEVRKEHSPGNTAGIRVKWKYILVALLLAALLAGVFIGKAISDRDDYIAIGDLVGEEVAPPDGEFHLGW